MVMGIFPRGTKADDPIRIPITETNKLLTELLEGKPRITFLDISNQFLEPDGSISSEVMADGIHPTKKGYTIWSKSLITAGIFK